MPRKVFNSDSEDDLEDNVDSDGEKETHDAGINDEALLADSDSDSAPEDITFDSSRKTALQKIKDAMQQIDADRKKVKAKRKQHDEQFKQQKKLKLERLKNSRLPDDVIASLPAGPVKVKGKKIDKAVVEPVEEEPVEADLSGEESDFGDMDDNKDDILNDDFIGFQKGGIQAVALKDYKRPQSAIEKAIAFKQERLFGGSIPRETAQERRLKQQRKKVNQGEWNKRKVGKS